MELMREDANNLTPFYVFKNTGSLNEYRLLGFKKGIAVFDCQKTMSVKKVNLQIDEGTGERYININGKKIKVVTQTNLSEEVRKKAKVLTNKCINQDTILPTGPSNFIFNPDKEATDKEKDNQPCIYTSSTLVEATEGNKISVSGKVKTMFYKNGQDVSRASYTKEPICKDQSVGMKINISDEKSNSKPERNNTNNIKKPEVKRMYTNSEVQTEKVSVVEKCCQTDSELDLDLLDLDLYLTDNFQVNMSPMRMPTSFGNNSLICRSPSIRNINDPKIKFFCDLRNALIMDNNGNMPIHDAVLDNNIANVNRFAVVLKSIGQTVNVLNQNNYSPLQLAIVSECDTKIIQYLLKNDAIVTITDSEGNSILHLAVLYNNAAALEVLCKYAVEKNIGVDFFNYEGFTPLMLSCINKNIKCAEILLKNNARPNVLDKKSGRTALFHAAENHHLEMVEMLLHYEADTKIRNFFGTSPHDAMFEMEEIPKDIRQLIWSAKKRKAKPDAPTSVKVKVVKTYQKIKMT